MTIAGIPKVTIFGGGVLCGLFDNRACGAVDPSSSGGLTSSHRGRMVFMQEHNAIDAESGDE